ncbi:4Fe-4S dicluster domain-containing protein [Sporomusa sp.]|uniref:4Fe-4S dicluster domain-containing protein n=1 Tax=Sporomusa sp. TaxID=2078658 RepID=UPI002B633A41|nr:4Fe-4S dicluster domain-containing protein [Sporomusa sp.]HWR06144.1 4Fe-4S dicluster domain-containing protein [Sporomusa sp.]
MPRPDFFQERCKGCELCTVACPKKLIVMSSSFNGKGYTFATCRDESECVGCALCGKACPDAVIEIYK